MIFRRRIFLMVGFASTLALAATSASASMLDLETVHLGNVFGDQMLAKGKLEVFHGGAFAGGCFSEEAVGEYLVASAAKDSASWEPECEVVTGTGTLQLTAKGKATLSAATGTEFGFAVPRGEECAWESKKLKGAITSLNPVTIHLSTNAKRFPDSQPSCAKKALIEAEYVLWADEPPFDSFEEVVTGTIVK